MSLNLVSKTYNGIVALLSYGNGNFRWIIVVCCNYYRDRKMMKEYECEE